MTLIYIAIAVWAALNYFEIILCSVDKCRAKRDAWRIPEKVLLLIGLCGGSFGLMLGMLLFHHKVSKPAFRYGAPAMALLHTVLVIFAFCTYASHYQIQP